MKKVAIYTRVSTKDQSSERQKHELKKLVKADDEMKLVKVYSDEGISGTVKSRPAFDELMKDCQTGKVDTILCTELSRIGRSLKNMLAVVEELKALGVTMIFKNQNVDTSTPAGMLFLNMLGCISEYERELMSERVKSKLTLLKDKNVKLGRPTNLNNETREQIIFLRSRNVGVNKIAKRLNVGVGTIYKVMKEAV